jgi:hypothetical protein
MTNETKRPFWQSLILTLIAATSSSFIAYKTASDEGKNAASQAWATAEVLLKSHEDRIRELEKARLEDSKEGAEERSGPISAARTDFAPPTGFTDKKSKNRDEYKLLPLNDERVQRVRKMYR